MENYLLLLFEQFKRTQGMNSSVRCEDCKKEFNDWLSMQQSIKERYAQLLTEMYVGEGLIAELGRGSFDSIVPNLNEWSINAIAITPFAETFMNPNFEVYNGELILLDGNSTIMYKDGNNNDNYPNCNATIDTSISTLITQLPSNHVSVNALMKSSRQNNDIAIGCYGNTNDKNARENIDLLRKIKSTIENQYCVGCDEELITNNGTYSHIITRQQKKLILEKLIRHLIDNFIKTKSH
jgi:hypothetical protein